MKEIVHIIPAHPLFHSMTEFWIESFPEYDVTVYLFKSSKDKNHYIISNNKVKLVEYKNNQELSNQILRIVKDSSIVYLHCLFMPFVAKWLLLRKGISKYFNRLVWIEWGSDLYYWDSSSAVNFVKSVLKKVTGRFFEKKFHYFVAIHPADKISYKKLIGGKAELFCAPYTNLVGVSKDIEKHQKVPMSLKRTMNEPIVIQINHRADHILNHKEVLDSLKRFSNENIQILLPLCYGDNEYGKKIAEYAKHIFGDKVIVQSEVVAYQEYMQTLKSVDIFILNSKRQIALGNFFPMMMMEKKIILPTESVLYDYYGKEVPFFPYEKLKDCGFDELVQDVDMSLARKIILDYKNILPVEAWRDVFSLINKNSSEKGL